MTSPAIIQEAQKQGRTVLSEIEAKQLLATAGVPVVEARLAHDADEAAAIAFELGFPVDVHAMGEMAADTEKLTELRNLIREMGPAQKGLRVVVRLLDERESAAMGARSVLETSREKSTAEKSKREAEAREHPITKHVLQTFGAQIKEIKTDV